MADRGMKYVSTRGGAPELGFEDVLLTGLARDGGLYVPAEWPSWSAEDFARLQGASYVDIAWAVMRPFVDGAPEAEFRAMLHDAYAGFAHREVAPLRQLGADSWLMELFHGPTLAFKDVALQLLGLLFDRALTRRGARVTVVGATSGDTGSAAIEACRDRANLSIFMLHPKGRVSEVQRRQMTTVLSPNVRNIAVEGSFDECQAMVKAMFNDLAFRDALSLAAVNSINWARVLAQVVYYVAAAVRLGAWSAERRLAFAVPTGNFGDVYAGWVAWRMGLPLRLLVATNRNDILDRFFRTREYRAGEVRPTQSPSMDIQVASNFERFLHAQYGGDGARVAAKLGEFARSGAFVYESDDLAAGPFLSCAVSEAGTTAAIRRVHAETGMAIDPHTAVGVAAAAERLSGSGPIVCLATAHPAKFPDAVELAIGLRPELPPRLADLMLREERCVTLPNDLGAIQAYIRSEAA
jgi:threonine synthase